jgi:hypothetical protein
MECICSVSPLIRTLFSLQEDHATLGPDFWVGVLHWSVPGDREKSTVTSSGKGAGYWRLNSEVGVWWEPGWDGGCGGSNVGLSLHS